MQRIIYFDKNDKEWARCGNAGTSFLNGQGKDALITLKSNVTHASR